MVSQQKFEPNLTSAFWTQPPELKHQHPRVSTQNQSTQNPSTQNLSTQHPSTQNPANHLIKLTLLLNPPLSPALHLSRAPPPTIHPFIVFKGTNTLCYGAVPITVTHSCYTCGLCPHPPTLASNLPTTTTVHSRYHLSHRFDPNHPIEPPTLGLTKSPHSPPFPPAPHLSRAPPPATLHVHHLLCPFNPQRANTD